MTSNVAPDPVIVIQPSDSETSYAPEVPSDTLMLPVPSLLTNPSQSSFMLSEVIQDGDALLPELACAEISVAPDKTFVETPSGPAARELKKHWDQQLGVGKDVRSPYAITAFVNQHGKQMFRVGPRELSAPAANAAEIEERIAQTTPTPSEPSTSPRAKRRSRMSMHNLPSIFNKNSSITKVNPTPAPAPPRKLRKTRSIPDMGSTSNDADATTTSITGRLHSRSVTGADVSPFSTVVRNPNTVDLFWEVMDWHPPPSTAVSISTNSLTSDDQSPHETHDQFKSTTIIAHPFGHGVSYDMPSRKNHNTIELLPLPRHLREVQSFESGLTARQVPVDPPAKRAGRESSLATETYLDDSDSSRPPSALRLFPPSSSEPHDMTSTSSTPQVAPSPAPESEPVLEVVTEPTLLSRYSIEPEDSHSEKLNLDVFDILQTFRGLPLLDKLSPDSELTTVIKLSLSADESAAPRDDPRFVIWGEIQLDRDPDDMSIEYESVTDLSVYSSSLSKRRASKAKAVEIPSSQVPSETQKVLIAATIERWIAQLTSDLNYDELLDFFLTYRTYVSSVDLCHLLIARFHWALQISSSLRDERVRRIVRVRTFVAIRYWLLTFFTVDFIPNRELRLLVASWLNSLVRDPILRKHVDSLGIVRKLMKVAKECKQAHTRLPARSSSKPRNSMSSKPQNHVLGAKFAAATRKASGDDDDSDVDLDFLPDVGAGLIDPINDIANAHLNVIGTTMSGTRTASIPYSSFSILQRTDHAAGPSAPADLSYIQQAPVTLPTHRSAVSRVIVKTIGRLGRWKRTLRSAPSAPLQTEMSASADVSAFDLDLNGVERHLVAAGSSDTSTKTVEVPVPLSPVPPRLPTPPALAGLDDASHATPSSEQSVLAATEPVVLHPTVEPPAEYSDAESASLLSTDLSAPTLISDDITAGPSTSSVDADQVSIRSSTSTDSFGAPLTAPTFPPLARPQWQFDVISIDDLSDTSSDHNEAGPSAPPGLRRPPKKLPTRREREFEFVRRDTVSSMGFNSRDSAASGSSDQNSNENEDKGPILGGGVAQWQLNALIDSLSDDEEKGDVEDALKRLEGQINPMKQQEKASKVDGWVRTIRERLAAGDYSDEQPPFSDDSDEEDCGDSHNLSSDSFDQDSASVQHDGTPVSLPSGDEEALEFAHTPIPTQTAHVVPDLPGLTSPARPSDAKPSVEAAVPFEIIQGRLPSRPSTSSSNRAPVPVQFVSTPTVSYHRSFILERRAADIAQHFAMIDRELFMGVKFEELVLDDWMSCKEVDVLDWTQFLKDRARWKVEHRYPDKTSALGAVRARFNLMANFTISEVVMTHPNERPLVVSKLIRIAWKAYRMCNFSTLVAIITGLGSDWVAKAMKRVGWSRVGFWENRMFRDLKVFASSADDFKYIRQIVTSIVDAKSLDVNSHTASVASGGGTDTQSGKGKAPERPPMPSACIPFIGVYLSQLQRLSRLPDLIDPTAPDEAVGVNPHTSNFDTLAHPEVFSALTPLPSFMHLEPLINVHKQRRIAGVIKALVAGQHLASRVQFEVDKKMFQKCLKVRAVNADTLQNILSVYE
ncbi:hypothetical protein H0H87_008645 [Tephrocybe sp. NHM501043]|nr:hypothetical protein H0H87_008645 [Tephrocybe sp. NHM501043]